MKNRLNLEINNQEIFIEAIYTDREVNFKVSNREGYLFRLVPANTFPGEEFDLSPLDKSLGSNIDSKLVLAVSEAIQNHYL